MLYSYKSLKSLKEKVRHLDTARLCANLIVALINILVFTATLVSIYYTLINPDKVSLSALDKAVLGLIGQNNVFLYAYVAISILAVIAVIWIMVASVYIFFNVLGEFARRSQFYLKHSDKEHIPSASSSPCSWHSGFTSSSDSGSHECIDSQSVYDLEELDTKHKDPSITLNSSAHE